MFVGCIKWNLFFEVYFLKIPISFKRYLNVFDYHLDYQFFRLTLVFKKKNYRSLINISNFFNFRFHLIYIYDKLNKIKKKVEIKKGIN